MPFPRGLLSALAALSAASLLAAAAMAPAPIPRSESDEAFFRERVLPILEASCFECHGPAVRRPKGGLVMDGLASLLRGGFGGPVIVPGDPDASALVQAARYTDETLAMPPDGPLAPDQVATLEDWVARGAPWPAGYQGTSPVLEPTHGELLFFEQEVRPLLAGSCFPCHGPDVEHPKSGFRMAGREGFLLGGERGPALVPGDPPSSRLLQAVRYEGELAMPPDSKLSAEDVATLERWIAIGAPWPAEDAGHAGVGASGAGPAAAQHDLEDGRRRWAFSTPAPPDVPAVTREGWTANPIDAFVLARLEAAGLEPSPEAPPRDLVRRAYFTLIGLPPTLGEVERFLADERPGAWPRLVDELLARPEYGERWARHWLDVVRFAQTNGYERDAEKPYAWRYRDWVIRALNEDVPFDRFVTEQLAGDELPDVDADSLVATGFWRIGAWDDEPDDAEQALYDELDDSLRVVTEGMLGVTIGCARCHDHRFDPFAQEDYYGLLAFTRSVRRYEDPVYGPSSATLAALEPSAADLARWREEREQAVRSTADATRRLLEEGERRWIRARLAELPPELAVAWTTRPGREESLEALTEEESRELRELYTLGEDLRTSYPGNLSWALVVRDQGPEPLTTQLLARGSPSAPGAVVLPRFPLVLAPSDEAASPPPPEPTASSTGLRRRLAEWVTSAENPLFARVIANRLWHHHFGRGIVATPDDFGSTGIPPTHPELLDWLACELVERGWSLKELHRLILSSATWRQSSRTTDPRALELDPANDLLWRQRRRRIEAEAIRDSMLAASGSLTGERWGRGFFPDVGGEALAGMSKPGSGWEPTSVAEAARRSVYAFVKRGMLAPIFTTFDTTTASLPIGARPTTTTATQALLLLNGDFAARQAEALAHRVATGTPRERWVERAFELALARSPTPEEEALLESHLAEQARAIATVPSEIVVEPRLPERLATDFLARLRGDDVLYAPSEGWVRLLGRWGGAYNDTQERDPYRGPVALCERARVADGVVRGRLSFERGCELAALLVRAAPAGDVASGIEVALLPEEGALEVRLHAGSAAEEDAVVVARAEGAPLESGRDHELAVHLEGARVRVVLGGAEILAVEDPRFPSEGLVGLSARGGALRLSLLAVTSADGRQDLLPVDPSPPELRALESLCLLILNSNEFVVVD